MEIVLWYDPLMPLPRNAKAHARQTTLPLIVEQDEDGYYVVECPVLAGCYTQGKTLDEALKNIQEVIALLAEEEEARAILRNYVPTTLSFHTVTIAL